MAFKFLQLLFLILTTIAPHVISKHNPIPVLRHLQGSRKGDNVKGIHNIKTYLRHYGYLSPNTNTKSQTNDMFDDALESAIKLYQKRSNLNTTGVLDQQTLAQISRPRCGVPDIIQTKPTNKNNNNNNNNTKDDLEMTSRYAFFPDQERWPNTKFHLTYTFTNNFPMSFIPSVTTAMSIWATNSQFTFSEALDGQLADIDISFQRGEHGDLNPFDGPGGILAHAFAPTDGRLHLDADERWAPGNIENEFNVMTVALHELGHVLGLAHSSLQQAIMWPYIDPASSKGLDEDDVVGLRALYA